MTPEQDIKIRTFIQNFNNISFLEGQFIYILGSIVIQRLVFG